MKYLFAALILLTALSASADSAPAKEPFTGVDYSGVYACTGDDSHEGKYTGKVTITAVPSQSVGVYGAYEFKLEVPGYGTYLGQAAAEKDVMGIYFALTDPTPKDFGTGIARFNKNEDGKWSFKKYYYEPDFKGGNYGTEECVQQ